MSSRSLRLSHRSERDTWQNQQYASAVTERRLKDRPRWNLRDPPVSNREARKAALAWTHSCLAWVSDLERSVHSLSQTLPPSTILSWATAVLSWWLTWIDWVHSPIIDDISHFCSPLCSQWSPSSSTSSTLNSSLSLPKLLFSTDPVVPCANHPVARLNVGSWYEKSHSSSHISCPSLRPFHLLFLLRVLNSLIRLYNL